MYVNVCKRGTCLYHGPYKFLKPDPRIVRRARHAEICVRERTHFRAVASVLGTTAGRAGTALPRERARSAGPMMRGLPQGLLGGKGVESLLVGHSDSNKCVHGLVQLTVELSC